jgi:hypothetical protein
MGGSGTSDSYLGRERVHANAKNATTRINTEPERTRIPRRSGGAPVVQNGTNDCACKLDNGVVPWLLRRIAAAH